MDRKKYQVLFSAIALNFLSGFIYMWSLFSKNLVDHYHWSAKEASLPYTVFIICFVLAMLPSGLWLQRSGPRPIASLGSLLLGAGLILTGLFLTPPTALLFMGVVSGSGVGMLTVVTAPCAVKWFSADKKGRITGLVVAGAGLSSSFYSPLAAFVLPRAGIERTFILFGLIAAVLCLILSQGLKNPQDERWAAGTQRPDNADGSLTGGQMLRTPTFYKLWLMLAFAASAGLMIIGHVAGIAALQAKWAAGFLLVVLLSVCNTLGRILGGLLSDKIGRITMLRTIFTAQAINMALFFLYREKISLSLGVALAGFCYGALFSVFPAMVSDLYGPRHFGFNYGLMFTGWAAGGVLGPMLAAMLVDLKGNYALAYPLAGGLLVMALVLSLSFNGREKKV